MSNIKYIVHNRFDYYSRTTIGNILLDGAVFCYTLEDTVRGVGIKVYGETAIPHNPLEGYKVWVRYSPSFKRKVLILYTENDKYTLIKDKIKFEAIYAHGLNVHEETKGCIGVAHQRSENKIWNSAEKDLFDIVYTWIKEGYEVRWLINNGEQEK